MKTIKLKRGFWYAAIVVFTVAIYFVDSINSRVEELQEEESGLAAINEDDFYQSIENDKGAWGVLFYMKDSPHYMKMENNLSQIKSNKFKDLPMYKLNIEDYPDLFYNQNLAGTPVFVLYKEGKEAKRVMGKVSTLNLNLILNRIVE